MSKTKKYVLAGLVFLLLLGVFVFDRPQVAAQGNVKPPDQVQVMNAAGAGLGQNVPISGSVGITGTPTVAISGTPNVNIGTPNVNVANLSAAPVPVRDVDNPARQPFQTNVFMTIPNGSNGSSASFDVAAGKRLVIEYVSASTSALSAGQGMLVTLGQFQFFGTTYAGGFVAVSQTTRLYAAPGTSVTVDFNLTGGATCGFPFPGCLQKVHLSGYLVDL